MNEITIKIPHRTIGQFGLMCVVTVLFFLGYDSYTEVEQVLIEIALFTVDLLIFKELLDENMDKEEE